MPPNTHPNTPYVIAAFFCEKVLQEKDGVLTAIRIFDRISVQWPQGATPTDDVSIAVTLLTLLKGNGFVGPAKISISGEGPSGRVLNHGVSDIDVVFGSIDPAVNVIANVTLAVKEDGVHWFAVALNGEELTRTPLHVARSLTASQTGTKGAPPH